MLSEEKLEQIVIEALTYAYDEHKKLGKNGLESHHKNRFGDTCLEADWLAEECIIQTLKNYKVPITIISEEHGRIELGKDFIGLLDGLDGTNRYIANMKDGDSKARYGTMFAILKGSDPRYVDSIVSGMMEHPTKRLFIATKRGGFVRSLDTYDWKALGTSGKIKLDNMTRILIDYCEPEKNLGPKEYYAVLKPYMERLQNHGFTFNRLFSTEAHYASLVTGEADILLEGTRKNNLEIGVAYNMMKQAGGVIVTLDGKDIGEEKYFEFGQKEHVPVISAANLSLAKEFIKLIKGS